MEFGSKEDLDDDDILPDTNIDRERTTTGRWAIFVFFVSATFMTVAMVSPNWIEADERFYGTKVQRVGLWVHCFRSFPDYNDPEHQRFYAGCRWIFNPFTPGYDQIRNFLAPRKALDIFLFFIVWAPTGLRLIRGSMAHNFSECASWYIVSDTFLTTMTLNTSGSMLDAHGVSIQLPLATIKFAIF